MNIKILDSWLREFLETNASVKDIARELSLRAVSVDKVEKTANDYVYHVEVTTNRVDLMSHIGIAKEAAAALSEQGISTKFIPPKYNDVKNIGVSFPIEIINDPKLVNRIMARVLEVKIGYSPEKIRRRLEESGMRSLNSVVDVTNYVMREVGHPSHVFDFDLLSTRKMDIRQSRPGETLTTLDGKKYRLTGGDIVAVDDNGEIIDLLGVMGTANSVVQENTKRIIFFLDNNNPKFIRRSSMSLGIRTEAAIINEKGIDPELMKDAFKRGIKLFEEIAEGKVISDSIDIYPNKSKKGHVTVSEDKISSVIGIDINSEKSADILRKLGFEVKIKNGKLDTKVPTLRPDVTTEEDIIEEVARIFGYHKLPSIIPSFLTNKTGTFADRFYFEKKSKNFFKYLGFTEIYNYSLVSEDLFDGPVDRAIKLKNPLSEDMMYLRNSLVPSLLTSVDENKGHDEIKIFEMSGVYEKRQGDLPKEILMLAGVVKRHDVSFFEVKGIIEALTLDLGIKKINFNKRSKSPGSDIYIDGKFLGYIEVLDGETINFELNFEEILNYANNKKTYKKLAKYPPIFEDITFVLDTSVLTEDVINEILNKSFLIKNVTLKDRFSNSRTFHITYQAEDRSLSSKDVFEIHKKIVDSIGEKFAAKVK